MESIVVRLPRKALARRDAPARLAGSWRSWAAFAFKCDELAFARALLERRSNLWLYRSSQRAFAGDFIVVDLSRPAARARSALVLELKRGQRLRIGAPTSVQLRNAPVALRELAGTGVVAADCPLSAVTGDGAAILDFLGAGRAG
jgi:hypothetical protein